MTPLLLALTWALLSALACALRHPLALRLLPAVPTAGLVATAVTAHVAGWAGPAGDAAIAPALGRAEWGLLLLAAASAAVSSLLSPALTRAAISTLALVSAATVVVLSASLPLVWAVAVAIAVAAMALRWIGSAPGAATLAAGRLGGVAAAALLAAASLLRVAGPQVDPRTALAGGLIAGALAALLGFPPLGGWISGGSAVLRGLDFGVWGLLLAPALLLAATVLIPSLPRGSRVPVEDVLLVMGLAGALWHGLLATRVAAEQRYRRLLAADLALAAAGIGSTHTEGYEGALLLILVHCVVGPLMLVRRRDVRRQQRVAWVALCGLPPTPLSWGRFLVFEGLSLTHPEALLTGLAVGGLLFVAAVRALTARGPGEPAEVSDIPAVSLSGSRRAAAALAWALPAVVLVGGFLPALSSRVVFGVG